MSEFKNLTLDVADEIAVLAIARPAALNALNSETLDELNVALTEIEARDDVKVVILTGGPDKKGNEFKSFVAGAILQAYEHASDYNRCCKWFCTWWWMRNRYGL